MSYQEHCHGFSVHGRKRTRPIFVDNGMMTMRCWNADAQDESVGGDGEEEGEARWDAWDCYVR